MFSSISACRLPVQAKLPSLQLKVNSNYFLPVKYISNLVVIVDRFLSKACVCGLHLHNGAKRQLPEDGVWKVVTVYYFRHCAILLSVSGYDISCLPLALSQK